jgi:hypothetical protein
MLTPAGGELPERRGRELLERRGVQLGNYLNADNDARRCLRQRPVQGSRSARTTPVPGVLGSHLAARKMSSS